MRIKTKDDRRHRIQLRLRKRISGTSERPRLTVFRSVSHIYAQVIDDLSGKTLVAASSVEPSLKGTFAKDVRGGNIKGAQAVGQAMYKQTPEGQQTAASSAAGGTPSGDPGGAPGNESEDDVVEGEIVDEGDAQ